MIFLEFVPPEAADGFVANAPRNVLPVCLVPIEAKNIRKPSVVLFQERVKGIAQDMLHTDAPRVRPQFLQGFKEAGDGKRDFVVAHAPEWVIPEGTSAIWRIEINDAALLFSGRITGDPFHKVAMRVEKREAASCCQVFLREGFKECGLSHAS